jgi:cell division protein FtsW (lipid II flippase)
MGLVVLIGVSISDYRKWQSSSIYIYVFTIIGWLLSLKFGLFLNGLPYLIIGPFSINIVNITPYLLVIAIAGILVNYDWNNTKAWLKSLVLFIIPIILFLASSSFSGMIIFASGFVVIMYFSGARLYQIASILALPMITGILTIISQPYRLDRLTMFLKPQADLNGTGYHYMQIGEAIKDAGYFGQGFNISSYAIPELHTDFVFTYIVFTFGWIAGILILFASLALFVHVFQTVKKIKNEYGSLLIIGLSTILLVQIIWHILMNLGCLPITAMGLPFMSYGGSQLLIQMLVVGILLSVYRLKDVVLITNSA